MSAGGGSLRRAALLTAALTLAGAVLGLARDVAVAGVFGAGPAVDAYLVAQGLMNLVLALVAGAIAKAAIPVVARSVAAGRTGAGMRSVGAALGLALTVLGLGATAMWLGAPGVVAVLGPGLDRPTAALAVELARIVLLATVLISATNLLAGAGQALGRFGPAALQGVVFNVVMVLAAVVAGPVFGITALAWGFVLGSGARLLLQLAGLRGLAVRPWPSLRWRDPGLREMLHLVPALLVGGALSTVNTLVDRAVSSTLEPGAVAAVSFAARLSSTLDLLFVAALLAALYPRLAAAAAGDGAALRELVGRGVRVLLTVLVPVAVVLAVAAEPVVRLVFGYGQFDEAAVRLTAAAAGVLAVGVPVLAVREVVVRTAYALGDGRIPVVTAVVGMVVNVVGDLVLAPRFGVAGVAAATVASVVVAALTATWWLRRRHGAVPPLGGYLSRVLGAGLVGLALGLAVRLLLADVAGPVVVASVGLAVLAGYLPLMWWWCRGELRTVTALGEDVLGRFRRG